MGLSQIDWTYLKLIKDVLDSSFLLLFLDCVYHVSKDNCEAIGDFNGCYQIFHCVS